MPQTLGWVLLPSWPLHETWPGLIRRGNSKSAFPPFVTQVQWKKQHNHVEGSFIYSLLLKEVVTFELLTTVPDVCLESPLIYSLHSLSGTAGGRGNYHHTYLHMKTGGLVKVEELIPNGAELGLWGFFFFVSILLFFKNKTLFLNSLRFTVKLRGRNRDFPIPSSLTHT